MAVPRKKGNKKTGIRLKDNGISDGKTRVTPLPKEQKKFQQKSAKLKKPLLIAGFPGPGLVGSISANYIIQKLNLHQIAYVESEVHNAWSYFYWWNIEASIPTLC